jgi:hypothetical protein
LFWANHIIFGDFSRYVNEEILEIGKPKAFLNLNKLGLAFKTKGGFSTQRKTPK